ncbi:MAG TPA: SDR family oxidoreductase, partial [Victivallales bacterium]|nr:SDR family oxidoreductase [Victivallales bacterium]
GANFGKQIVDLSLNEWNDIINLNLTSAFLFSKYSIPIMREGSSIINISSTRAFQSEKNTEAYSAAKGGIISLTHALAISLGPKIRVNCISPGWIQTDGWRKKSENRIINYSEADHKQHPAGRIGTPDDIANLTYFLSSDEATFITGQNFICDGGMTKKMIYV